MSYIKKNNENDNHNKVSNEESNITPSTTLSDSQSGTLLNYAEIIEQIELSRNADDGSIRSDVLTEQHCTQTNDGFQIISQHQTNVTAEYLEAETEKSMFVLTGKDGKLLDIATTEERDDDDKLRKSSVANPCAASEDYVAIHTADMITNTPLFALKQTVEIHKQKGDNLSIKNLAGKNIESTATVVAESLDVVGDGMRRIDVFSTNTTTATTIPTAMAKDTDDTSLTILATETITTTTTSAKPPIPKPLTSPSSPSSPSALPMSTTTITSLMGTTQQENSSSIAAIQLTHISNDDPTFGGILQSELPRNQQQQQQKMKSYHDTKQLAMWSKESILGSSIAVNASIETTRTTTTALTTYTGTIVKSGASSVTVSPCLIRKVSDLSNVLPRRVSFPKSDHELVTGYLEPANPWGHACLVKSISEIAELYVMSCRKHKTKPLQTVLDHLKGVELNKQQRQPMLSLKSIKLAASDCEALEEIFKRVQYKFIDLSSCDLDEWATSALFEMIEYYEATHELDISSNSKGMTTRGWSGCIAMVKHSEELRVLIAQGNPISKQSADGLGQAISASNLHTLKLEHCGLRGALDVLCFKLRHNTSLKELWLAHNDLDYKDAEALGDLLKVNHYIELIDISNNNIRDQGLLYIVEALILQSHELERRSMLQRSSAIDDDDSLSSIETSQTTYFDISDSFSNNVKSNSAEENMVNSKSGDKMSELGNIEKKSSDVSANTSTTSTDNHKNDNLLLQQQQQHQQQQQAQSDVIVVSTANATTNGSKSTIAVGIPTIVAVVGSLDEMDGDDDTEDTVKSCNQKNGSNAHSGKSMLDKLLSMNSESSSEECASNLSTDTIAACGSEDVSITSDDIFETSVATGTAASASTETQKNNNSNVKTANESIAGAVSAMNVFTEKVASDFKMGQVKSEEKMELIDLTSSETVPAGSTYDNSSNSSSNEMAASHGNNHNETVARTTSLSNNENNSNNNTTTSSMLSDTDGDEDVCRKYKDEKPPVVHDQDNQNQNILPHQQPSAPNVGGVYEVTAGESDCTIAGEPRAVSDIGGGERLTIEHTPSLLQQQLPSKAMDVNKNTKLTDDYDDTHSTDSAFESASEGDISRHLPEEYSRISTSFDGAPIDDIVKGDAIETGTIATESIEYLADAGVTPTSTPTPPSTMHMRQLAASLSALDGNIDANCQTITPNTSFTANTYASVLKAGTDEISVTTQTTTQTTTKTTVSLPPTLVVVEKEENPLDELPALPKVTIASDSFDAKDKEALRNSPIPTPPPPSTSPGGASHGMRRTESSVTFITPATRHRSQSSDSLCSDNSLDGSISSDLNFSTSSQLNEKLTKNDTLTRQQRLTDPRSSETTTKSPGGLKALALWNNNLSKEAGYYISHLLSETNSLELLNIGKNCLSNDFVNRIKDSLIRNTTLTTLGLQSAHLSANGIETLASILTFGGNSTLQRLDIRDNKLEVESLTKIAEVLKSNTTLTQIDIDDEPKRLSVGSEAHMDYTRVLENVRSMCSRNEKTQAQLQTEKTLNNSCGVVNKRRSGYYLGSRKISLTCHTRPMVVETTTVMASGTTPTTVLNTKLDAKRKTGARLRSPVPSPPTISPSSSPNRSRFQVFRVTESSPLTSPLAQTPPSEASSTSSLATNSNSSSISMPAYMPYKSYSPSIIGGSSSSLPTSSSLPSMSIMTSSTQSIKRFSPSARSRFLVSKIYEDPRVPLASRSLPPITPPIHLPPTPLAKHAPESAKLVIFNATAEATTAVVASVETKLAEGKATIHSTLQATTLIVTPPTPAIMETSGSSSSSSTNILEFNQNANLKQVDSTNVKAQIQTQQEDKEQSQLKPQTAPLQEQRKQKQEEEENPAQSSSAAFTLDSQVNTTTNTTPTSAQSANNNALSPICSSSSSSSSSSTSPASLHSNSSSSSTSTSSPLSAIFSSSSSDSTDAGIAGSGAIGSELSLHEELFNATGNRCPLAVFNDNDNDITLTKNSANELAAPATSSVVTSEDAQQRQRKVSWIANPGAVDKLRSLFFQRSSSPESHTQPHQANIVTNSTSIIPPNTTPNTTVAVNNATAFNLADCTLSDASSQQLLQKFVHASQQLSKVFRQNLSFGNEAATTTTTNTYAAITSGAGATDDFLTGGDDGSSGAISSTEQHNVTLIPTEMKQEIKENISPEHTINEETLRSYQKLTELEGAAARFVQEQQQQQTNAEELLNAVDGKAIIMNIPNTLNEDNNVKAVGGGSSATASTLMKEEQTTTKGSAASNASAST